MPEELKTDAKANEATDVEESSTLTDVEDNATLNEDAESSAAEKPSTLDETVEAAWKKSESQTDESKDKKSDVDDGATSTEDESTEDKDTEEDVEADSEAGDADKAKDADADLPFHNHPRFKELVEEKNTLKEQNQDYERLESFRKQFSISDEQFADTLEVLALMNTDPAKAREKLLPIVEQLNEAVGEKLPADLTKEVEDGLLPESRAKEIAKLRQQSQRATQHQQVLQQNQRVAAMQAEQVAIGQWETTKTKADPVFKPGTPKFNLVNAEFGRLYQQKPPRNPLEAVQLAEAAYATVDKWAQSFQPKQPVRKTLQSTGSTVKTKLPPPKTPEEAAERAWRRHEAA